MRMNENRINAIKEIFTEGGHATMQDLVYEAVVAYKKKSKKQREEFEVIQLTDEIASMREVLKVFSDRVRLLEMEVARAYSKGGS